MKTMYGMQVPGKNLFEFKAFINPTPREVFKWVLDPPNGGEARFLYDGRDQTLYVWPSNDAVHENVIRALDLKEKEHTDGYFRIDWSGRSVSDNNPGISIYVYHDSMSSKAHFKKSRFIKEITKNADRYPEIKFTVSQNGKW